ncbi:hypothetical protein MCOR27_007563 [Pyricularia oryzae]|uniref:alpha-1,2-Mannosidase n=2 Tax=Pyricularia TaxID=48558 RepID=A0ABQ8NXP5_PYRGI|nr:hypothetical protein MCOR01_007183 [Pyricularia oryzae]KAI6302659.1 hypothetical protein MCOR33_002083 [Pyricularia grisea]KAH9434228.1 hypothetical protein MCOR02_006247 [Pyricularia oryzae]KAI6262937.1 hypothetical protein MCOR19_000918 [Pyricularia oryzae]KAI6274073.1 hypothetical protein MCOR27_007563 [Pyricularia oryzae]
MIRFRRYRVFVVGALILLVLLFRVAQNSQWELEAATAAVYDSVHKGTKASTPTYGKPLAPVKDAGAPPSSHDQPPIARKQNAAKAHDDQDAAAASRQGKIDIPQLKGDANRPKTPDAMRPAAGGADNSKDTDDPSTKPVAINIPDRDPDQRPLAHDRYPPAKKQSGTSATTTTSKLHWAKKEQEDYPIPDDQVIPLPTGKPKAIPTIQHKFGKESAAAKEKREARLAQVKKEAKRAWDSYKKYAWGHDEVEPISLIPRDPFCGWAATLVDSLDTLWIMGLKDEFEDAYKALDDIDFTTTERSDIPVFETIIRYMGGLLAAYDMTGGKEGKYHKLLTKVEELAEVLMSVFDTPNRMPILYYRWQPQYAKQRLQASTMVSVAELGSMSMEFTRLAQLTGKNRYYDAIARITDAFDEWQQRGTALDGIFPQQIDASGCNRTVEPITSSASDASRKQAELGSPAIGPPEAPSGKAPGEESELRKLSARAVTSGRPGAASSASGSATSDEIPSIPKPRANTYNRDSRANQVRGTPSPDGCRPQGLVESSSGWGQYSMGGSQDSAYEYFPKQYILLGGLVDQYKKLHENAVAAIKKHLLYRPMIKQEDRTLLFSAAVSARGYGKDMSLTYQYEVTHLTCFLGGMFAMGGKIFQSEEDVAIGAQLADGCVWAYESTGSGIMPENSHVVPCQSIESCPWNETLWHEHLDPNLDWRNAQVADYKVKKKEWDQMVADVEKKSKDKADADWEAKKARVAGKAPSTQGSKMGKSDVGGGSKMPSPGFSVLDGAGPGVKPGAKSSADDTERVISAKDSKTYNTRSRGSAGHGEMEGYNRKRSVDTETGSWSASKANARSLSKAKVADPAMIGADEAVGGVRGSISLSEALSPRAPNYNPLWDLPPEPTKPQSHKEFVEEKIEGERIPPGFVDIMDKRYILRPEAIESVWYMYRITGDPVWQEKGWRMWEAVVAATRTKEGHSAVEDVTLPSPGWTNNMESFWIAETLKYFYLLYTTPDVVSLDDWVLNTEAHPFRRPDASS